MSTPEISKSDFEQANSEINNPNEWFQKKMEFVLNSIQNAANNYGLEVAAVEINATPTSGFLPARFMFVNRKLSELAFH